MFKSKQKRIDEQVGDMLTAELAHTALAVAPIDGADIVQISEYYAGKLDDLLIVNRRHESELSAQLADITERLRQTRLVIASLEPAQAKLAKDAKP